LHTLALAINFLVYKHGIGYEIIVINTPCRFNFTKQNE